MSDHETDAGVSPATVAAAAAAANALAAEGIAVEGVQFDYEGDAYRIVTPHGTIGAPGDGFDPQGIGGGNVKAATDDS